MNATFYGITVLFVLSAALTAFVAIRSPSPLRFVAPFSVLLSAGIAYAAIDNFIGTPKPIGTMPFWHGPAYGDCGATVLGAELGRDQIWLLLEEEDAPAPRIFVFSATPAMTRGLKDIMSERLAKYGQQFGFSIGVTDRCARTKTVGQQQGPVRHGHEGNGSDTDNPSFSEPVTRDPPPKA